ncbi:MAG: hypothetical protein LBU65_14330 [Planctomycetaceae bacterium]|jgi:hypothetical protein|nr:hypothetical protein [Planctomycetaceae bacterium]
MKNFVFVLTFIVALYGGTDFVVNAQEVSPPVPVSTCPIVMPCCGVQPTTVNVVRFLNAELKYAYGKMTQQERIADHTDNVTDGVLGFWIIKTGYQLLY